MDGDPMIDDEVAAHTRVTVLAYWKFESVSLQRRVCKPGLDLGRRLGEIWRVLRPAGLLQATVLSTRDANHGIGRAIAPDTFFSLSHLQQFRGSQKPFSSKPWKLG
jgi:hypothetical protein